MLRSDWLSVTERTIKGLFWAYGTFAGERFINFAISLVLARVLLPAEFGLIAFALLVITFADIFSDLGIKDALVWIDAKIEEAADTGFWLCLGLGVLQSAAILLLAPFAPLIIDDPRIEPILQVMAAVPLIAASGLAHEALLLRRLAFHRRYVGDLAAVVAKATVAFTLVAADFGVWSLIIAQLVSVSVRAISRWLAVAWRPRLRVSIAMARRLLKYGLPLFAATALDITVERMDQIAIAAFLGQVDLGYYYLAVRLPEMLITGSSVVLTKVLFPAFAAVKGDRAALRSGLTATMRYTGAIMVPLGFGMAAVASPLVTVLFGSKWAPSAPIMEILALSAVASALPWAIGDAVKAIGRPDLMTRVALARAVIALPLITGFAAAAGTGLSVAFATLLATAITAGIWYLVATRFLGAFPLVSIFGPSLLAGAVMVASVWAMRWLLIDEPSWLVLVASVITGAIVYLGVYWRIANREFHEGIAYLSRAFFPGRASSQTTATPSHGDGR